MTVLLRHPNRRRNPNSSAFRRQEHRNESSLANHRRNNNARNNLAHNNVDLRASNPVISNGRDRISNDPVSTAGNRAVASVAQAALDSISRAAVVPNREARAAVAAVTKRIRLLPRRVLRNSGPMPRSSSCGPRYSCGNWPRRWPRSRSRSLPI